MHELPQLCLPDEQLVTRILKRQVHELPSLPMVALKLLKLTGSENARAADLARIVETDPALAAKVLRLVNSAHYALRRKISSLSHAVVILGFTAIRAVALEITLFEQLVRRDLTNRFDRTLFWRHCLSVAGLCKAMAEATGHPDPEEAYAAGLLHDIGKLVLDVYGRISYRDFLQVRGKTAIDPLVEEEKLYIGLSHDQIGAFFCERWKFPEPILLAALFHHRPFFHLPLAERDKLLCAIVSLADFITWTQGVGSVRAASLPVLENDLEALPLLSRLPMKKLLATMHREIKEVGKFYDFSFPGGEEFRVNLLNANIRLSRMNSQHCRRAAELHQRLKMLGRVQTSLKTPEVRFGQQEIIEETFLAILQDFGYDHIALLQIGREERSLQLVDSWPHIEKRKRLRPFALNPQHGKLLFSLREKVPVIIGERDRNEKALLHAFEAPELAAIPLSAHGRTTGLLIIDNGSSLRPLLEADLSLLGIVANELGLALENSHMLNTLREKAQTDALTGIHNRGALDMLLQEALTAAAGTASPVVVGILDIDFFKRFNDTYGHQAGDSILRLLAATMKKMSRATDIVGRLGGEEFVFLLPGRTLDEGCRFAERLRREIERLSRLLGRRFPHCRLTVSIGLASSASRPKADRDQLLKLADEALYQAKAEGRNRVVCAPEHSTCAQTFTTDFPCSSASPCSR